MSNSYAAVSALIFAVVALVRGVRAAKGIMADDDDDENVDVRLRRGRQSPELLQDDMAPSGQRQHQHLGTEFSLSAKTRARRRHSTEPVSG
jgi:hypothetical protein